jgi:uncharacterized protein YbjQ (UPF0145 family)
MLAASGNINREYEVLGMVHAVVVRPQVSAGCGGTGGGLPVQEAYQEATKALHASAVASGGDGVIHVNFNYRQSATNVGCNNTKPTFEVYGWGTAIKLK